MAKDKQFTFCQIKPQDDSEEENSNPQDKTPESKREKKLRAEFEKFQKLKYPGVKSLMLSRFRRLRNELKEGRTINLSDK